MTAQLREDFDGALARISRYPRFRWMGSKYKLAPFLLQILTSLPGTTVADPFSGSGIVGYAAKAAGKRVIAGDYLTFSATLAGALIENNTVLLQDRDVAAIVGSRGDGRSFVSDTFADIFFTQADLAFIDRAWAAIDGFDKHRRALALSALCLAAARKQPRGVFTVSGLRYDDGRRQLATSLETLFIEAAGDINRSVFDNGQCNVAYCGDAMDAGLGDADILYLDPPYTPPRDDNDYIKRYHFLEGLAKYWRGETILQTTKVRKIEKRFTPFAYKRTIVPALETLLRNHSAKSIVLSYSSNAYPSIRELTALLKKHRRSVEVLTIDHRYHFGTHSSAERRLAKEYLFVCAREG